MAQVVLKELNKSFGSNQVLDSSSLDIEDGQVVALVGESGCGKTTLMRILCGLEKQDGGEILIGQNNVSSLSAEKRKQLI